VLVNVLMSTWNGQRFLAAQIDSILRQKDVDVVVTVRDDGSADGTLEILERYTSITLHRGAHLGAAASFLELLRIAAPADLYAFADQDDVWDDDHLAAAAARLGGIAAPALYCSRLRYIGEAGEARGFSRIPRVVGLENALVENIAVGCTTVFNEAARALATSCTPRHLVMHDAWLYLAVAALGTVIYDDVPRVAYRLHGGNAFGARGNALANALLHARRLVRQRGFGFHEQAAEFLRCHGERLTPAQRELVAAYALDRRTLRARLRCALRAPIARQSRVHELLFRVLIALDRD